MARSLVSPSSGNGNRDPKPRSGNTSAISNQRRSRAHPNSCNGVGAGAGGSTSTSTGSSHVMKLTTCIFLIAVADVMFMWKAISDSFEAESLGAETGLHNLHENQRFQHLDQGLDDRDKKASGQSESSAKTNFKANGNTKTSDYQIDERINKILQSARVEIDDETAAQLPTWNDIASQYGSEPIIYGLETCEPYRKAVKPEDRMIGPVGMFNTGTNLFFELMKENCNIKEARKYHREPKRNGMRWQAPWGKHNPPSTHRFKNVAVQWGKGINQTEFFPVGLIKDPYHWMISECRHKYFTFWNHDDKHCPNLVETSFLGNDRAVNARVKYALGIVHYESLLHIWNEWYGEYEEQTFPMLHTRFEDLLFHAEEVTKVACDCVGGVFTNNFVYVEESAKDMRLPIHKGSYGLVKALIQYGNSKNRLTGFTNHDRWYASRMLNSELMQKYGYVAPPLPTMES